MDAILIKILATALALSQVMTRQDAIATEFDPARDRARWCSPASDGCTHMRKAFDIEDINVDELIETAMSDPQASPARIKALRAQLADLHRPTASSARARRSTSSRRRSRRGHRLLQQGGGRSARPQQAERHEAPGPQRHARQSRRALRRAVRARPPPHVGAAAPTFRHCPAGLHRGRGQALLPAQGHRRARRGPRLHRQPRGPAGRRAARRSPSSW